MAAQGNQPVSVDNIKALMDSGALGGMVELYASDHAVSTAQPSVPVGNFSAIMVGCIADGSNYFSGAAFLIPGYMEGVNIDLGGTEVYVEINGSGNVVTSTPCIYRVYGIGGGQLLADLLHLLGEVA